MKAIANYNSIKDLIIWNKRIIATDLLSFSWSRTAGFSSISLLPSGQKSNNGSSFKHGLARKATEILTLVCLLLQMLTVGLLVFQHLVSDSLSLSLSMFLWSRKYKIVPDKSDITGFMWCPRQITDSWAISLSYLLAPKWEHMKKTHAGLARNE